MNLRIVPSRPTRLRKKAKMEKMEISQSPDIIEMPTDTEPKGAVEGDSMFTIFDKLFQCMDEYAYEEGNDLPYTPAHLHKSRSRLVSKRIGNKRSITKNLMKTLKAKEKALVAQEAKTSKKQATVKAKEAAKAEMMAQKEGKEANRSCFAETLEEEVKAVVNVTE